MIVPTNETSEAVQRGRMGQSVVEIEHLTHAYGEHVAVRDLSLAVRQGEIFGFLGPNGSGKTTLFRILCTLIRPSQDQPPTSVRILGMDLLKQRESIRQQIGVVFQYPSLDKQLTADENLRHHGHLYGIRGAELNRRMERLLSRLKLIDRRHEKVGNFSGGMRRRVELAKGLLNQPRVLLLDEPSTGLDPGARIDLWHYLQEIQAQDGVTILMTTHLMDEADKCGRLAIMEKGSLVACDSPATLKSTLGGDVITLCTTDPTRAREMIQRKFDINPEPVDQTLRIQRERGHEFIPALIGALPGLVESVSVGKPTLEDVFIHFTGHRFG
ncbi:MAG: ATP-binding cassette domain-containing protein [Phycisphaerales bacterium]|jgi:ABC-2 type transport system ATP-binding protein|nr:ATP-binding cassette domain-containing protein [Phycisphaerales bacterium]